MHQIEVKGKAWHYRMRMGFVNIFPNPEKPEWKYIYDPQGESIWGIGYVADNTRKEEIKAAVKAILHSLHVRA